MTSNWVWLLALCSLAGIGSSLPTSLMEDMKKADQAMRPKPKRAQEMLMFGNQQNRPSESANNPYTMTPEKRTLSSSGLGGLKAALAEEEKPRAKTPGNNVYERETYNPYEKNYDYGKVLVNDLAEEMPRVWDVPPYSRYYPGEERRKRSEKSPVTTRTTTVQPPTSSYQVPTPTQQSMQAQVKRSVPIYQEPRYKRDLDIDPEYVLALLQLWENQARNRNWRKYANEEFDNVEEDSSLMEEEDPRNVVPWMDSPPVYSHHYGADTLSPSDIGIVRTHPPSYYEQYGNQYGQQYENAAPYGDPQYGNPQYGLAYPQRTYYPPEKRFMVSRKRSQGYDPYTSGAQLQMGPQQRGYPYQHRMVY